MKKIFVLASFMYDLVTTMKRFPEAKETVNGIKFETFPGGKGDNQSLAIKRLGGDLYVNGMIGKDNYGDKLIDLCRSENIDTSGIKRGDLSTGIACIQIDETGQNRICIVPGANEDFKVEDLDKDKLDECDIFLTQFEMKKEVTDECIKIAKSMNKAVVVNPAPAREIANDVYPCIDYITPNEKEIEILTGVKVETPDDAYKASRVLLSRGVKNVICTLGEQGCTFVNNERELHVESFKVKPVDSTAAGDSFNGALCFGLANGYPIEETLKMANAMGALTTQTKGATPSIKTYKELMSFIDSHK